MHQEFELWKASLTENQQEGATGFFTVIKRKSELSASQSNQPTDDRNHSAGSTNDLFIVPYSKEYDPYLKRAAELLRKAGDVATSFRYITSECLVVESSFTVHSAEFCFPCTYLLKHETFLSRLV